MSVEHELNRFEIEDIKLAIQSQFPELIVDTIEYEGEGEDSTAYKVNGEYIFRFPKKEKISVNLEHEISLLPRLKEYVGDIIPNFEFVGEYQGRKFVGYKMIKGEQLLKNKIQSLTEAEKTKLAFSLAGFINGLRKFPVEEAEKIQIERVDLKVKIEKEYRKWSKFFSESEPELAAFLDTTMEKFPNLGPESLLHADLSGDHLIYNLNNKQLAGIIDFGDLQIGDQDFELRYLYEEFGEGFVKILQEKLEHRTPNLIGKLKFFEITLIVHDAVRGAEKNNSRRIREAMQKLKHLAKTYAKS